MEKEHIIKKLEILERYCYTHKRYLIGEIQYLLFELVGFEKDIIFSEPIKEYDKIRINDITGIRLHYNSIDCGEGWTILDTFFDISIIYDILSELRIYAAENL